MSRAFKHLRSSGEPAKGLDSLSTVLAHALEPGRHFDGHHPTYTSTDPTIPRFQTVLINLQILLLVVSAVYLAAMHLNEAKASSYLR